MACFRLSFQTVSQAGAKIYTSLICNISVFLGSRTLCRVPKLPGRRVLCGSLSERCEGRPPNCVEVQQCYRTLSAVQHQLYTVVSGRHTCAHTHIHAHKTEHDLTPNVSVFQLHCDGWERLSCRYQNRVSSIFSEFIPFFFYLSRWNWTTSFEESEIWIAFPLFRPGTTIAAAVGGVVLFFILLALLFFYLRRQKKLKRKETMRRILQEHEVGENSNRKCCSSGILSCVMKKSAICCLRLHSWWSLCHPAVLCPIRLRCASWKRQSWKSYECWVLGPLVPCTRYVTSSVLAWQILTWNHGELFCRHVSGSVGSWWGKCENTSSHQGVTREHFAKGQQGNTWCEYKPDTHI